MEALGKLAKVDPREIWKHEASGFTPWLEQNIHELGEALGLDLEVVEREAEVGAFAVDLVAKDLGRNRTVIIENQLAQTDHTHLGQIITYAAGKEAGVVVWVSPQFREEHRQALDWLNRTDGTEYFGVVVELLSVDGSRPAVNFRVISSPNEWSRDTARGTARDEISGRRAAYQRFFQALIDELREKHHFTNAKVAQPQNWCTFASGTQGFTYGVSFGLSGRMKAELYIDLKDRDLNKRIFDRVLADRNALEGAFGDALEWERLDEKQACRVASYWPGSIDDPEDVLQEHHRNAIDRLLRMKRTFGPRLAALAPK